jgi:uncharacterized membrane protein YvbJ
MVNDMPFCYKCGSEVEEENSFCPKCGVSLRSDVTRPTIMSETNLSEKAEKQEKQEKNEKEEKMEKGEQQEKYEKQEFGVLGPLIGGVILILVGFILYLTVSGNLDLRSFFPFILIIIGAIVMVGVIMSAVKARGKNPRP